MVSMHDINVQMYHTVCMQNWSPWWICTMHQSWICTLDLHTDSAWFSKTGGNFPQTITPMSYSIAMPICIYELETQCCSELTESVVGPIWCCVEACYRPPDGPEGGRVGRPKYHPLPSLSRRWETGPAIL